MVSAFSLFYCYTHNTHIFNGIENHERTNTSLCPNSSYSSSSYIIHNGILHWLQFQHFNNSSMVTQTVHIRGDLVLVPGGPDLVAGCHHPPPSSPTISGQPVAAHEGGSSFEQQATCKGSGQRTPASGGKKRKSGEKACMRLASCSADQFLRVE
jgi:hypothetical protein